MLRTRRSSELRAWIAAMSEGEGSEGEWSLSDE
jgi:hypothetical protein